LPLISERVDTMSQGNTIARAAGVVLVMNLISRVLGFGRDAAIAGQYGASAATDAYWVAYTIPFFLQAIFGVAFVSVMVPIFVPYVSPEKRQEGWQVAGGIFNLTAVALFAVILLGWLAAPWLVRITAPGFRGDLFVLTTDLTRVMFPSIIFMGLGMLITGILNAFKVFALPAFAPGAANIIIILAVIFFGGIYKIHAVAWGTLAGFVIFFLVQLPLLKKLGFQYRSGLHLDHTAVRKFYTGVWAVVLGMSVNQIYLALNRVFASGLQAGSISALNYAYRLMTLPLGIFVAAVATAIFPALARYAAGEQRDRMAHTLQRGLRMVLLVSVPAAVGLAVLKVPLVKLLFERGAFGAEDTLLTAESLLYFAPGLPALGINLVATRVYYALADVRTPVVTGMISVLANVLLSFALLGPLQAAGLALADTLAAAVNALMLLYFLRRREEVFSPAALLGPAFKILAISLVMGALALGAFTLGSSFLPLDNSFFYLVNTLGAVAAGAVAYAAGISLTGLEEAVEVRRALASRLAARK